MTPASGQDMQRTITAFFDSRSDAEEAVRRLHAEGFSRDSVRLVEGHERDRERDVNPDNYRSTYENNEGMGFWEALKDLFIPDEDRDTYAEGLRRGGYLVTVQTRDANYERALDILDDEGTIDIDERADAWRAEGWTGYSGTDRAAGTVATGAARTAGSTSTAGYGTAPRATGTVSTAGMAGRGSPEREEVIPVAEEQLRVGKREVSGGRVRVRSYVVETPVQEQVNLREEHVRVERRPADRPLTAGDNPFRERTIEAEEKREEAVVDKQARVKEELVVKKDADQRTETVSDKVRRTEVEVEDERNMRLSGTTGSTTDRKR
jgi:uncharacterized protein (TIGR02271 family)